MKQFEGKTWNRMTPNEITSDKMTLKGMTSNETILKGTF